MLGIDMVQNAHLPWLGSKQVGDFHYYSPITQLIHGIKLNGNNFLNSYIWKEEAADHGADNIVSLLHVDLKQGYHKIKPGQLSCNDCRQLSRSE